MTFNTILAIDILLLLAVIGVVIYGNRRRRP